MLDVISEHFKISHSQMRNEITRAHAATIETLQTKGITYSNLRTSLVPQIDRIEACFVFDTCAIDSVLYGNDVANTLIPLLDRKQNCSIFHGDLIHRNQDLAFSLLKDELVLVRTCEIVYTSQLYGVYINNLSKAMFNNIHNGLQEHQGYVGYIPTTFSSKTKTWLSGTLLPAYIKAKGQVLCGHEDDRPNEEDLNMLSWPFEENGYRCRSLQSMYRDLFLNYKIERAILPGFETDTWHALTSISEAPMDLQNFDVSVEEAKLDYLRNNKAGSIKRAGLAHTSAEELSGLIKEKISHNYIYNLRYEESRSQSFFNIILEIQAPGSSMPSRMTASLEYRPDRHDMRLITLY